VATLADLSFTHRAFMRLYRYRHVDWRPGHVLDKPLSAACVAAITSAGYYLPGQAPFDQSEDGGDCSYRVIDSHADLATLHVGNRSEAFDSSGLELDKNLALPLDRLHELARERAIGCVAPRHISIMGSITAPGRLVSRTAPEIAALLRQDAVDAVLLVPV
jgi:D-proline reductase (dithiol) PrdB